MNLIQHIKFLEGKDSCARGKHIIAALAEMGIKPSLQVCRLPRIKNIIVDFSPDARKKRLIFSAHYDVVKSAPGANDNASGVAVLLGLCQKLKETPVPVRVIFFDREEAWFRTSSLKLGLLGSMYYILGNGIRNVSGVFNVDFVGQGNLLVVWPLTEKELEVPAFASVRKAASRLNLPCKATQIPWLAMSSDHLSFRIRGLKNAVTLSLIPADRATALRDMISRLRVTGLLFGRRPPLPEPLSRLHTEEDTSTYLNEGSLRLALSLLKKIVKEHVHN